MDTASLAFESLLRSIHQAEYGLPGPMLNIEATYVGDDQCYMAWPPPRDDPFTAHGLRDPALGNTGPLLFAQIEALVVHAMPRHGGPSREYDDKFAAVAQASKSIQGVFISGSSIFLGRSGA